MTVSDNLIVDPEALREQVRGKYREVAGGRHLRRRTRRRQGSRL